MPSVDLSKENDGAKHLMITNDVQRQEYKRPPTNPKGYQPKSLNINEETLNDLLVPNSNLRLPPIPSALTLPLVGQCLHYVSTFRLTPFFVI
jgi:hypothetical protein